MRVRLALLLPLLAAAPLSAAAPAAPKPVPHFRLTDPRDQKVVDTAAWKDAKAVVVLFLGTECPVNNDYLPELARLYGEYARKDVRFVAVNSNRQDTPARVAEHARKHAVPFPVVKDPANKVADLFGARRTPEAFVLDAAGAVLYRGRIDDQFGIGYRRPGKPTRRDLAAALDEVLAGKPVSVPRTDAPGCYIGRVRPTKEDGRVTFAKHVSRVLQKNCQECHRAGQIGPMRLETYDDAVAWAETIREVIDDGRMPPWHADPRHGKWQNDRRLSDADKATLRAWLDADMPRGDDRDLPPPRQFPSEWTIGKPDVVFHMPRPYAVPAQTPKGGVPYQYFVLPTNFKEDMWVERAEARPGAPSVVHHIVIFVAPPKQKLEFQEHALCAMAPGELPMILEPGMAKKVPAGSNLIFQMHYTPNGKAVEDRSSVAMIFARKPPRHVVRTKPVMNVKFLTRQQSIPAGADNHQLDATWGIDRPIRVVSFFPHMHLRGKSFRFDKLTGDGKSETLLSVPKYDFNWQSVYRPAEPVRLEKGSRLRCIGWFDNSTKNPNNPDATKPVFWGDQTWEEMLVGWVEYYEEGEAKTPPPPGVAGRAIRPAVRVLAHPRGAGGGVTAPAPPARRAASPPGSSGCSTRTRPRRAPSP